MLKKIAVLFLFIMPALSTQVLSQQLASSQEIDFDFDYCRFRGSSGLVYLEIYFSIQRSDISFVSTSQGLQGSYEIETRIFAADSLLFENTRKQVSYADSVSDINPGQRLISLETLAVLPGDYKLRVRVVDLNDTRETMKETDLNIESIPADSLALSDIQLASHIEKSALESGQFIKNGYQVVPNPRLVYGLEVPMLYFYFEIYNLHYTLNSSQYRLRVTLLDRNGQEIRIMQEMLRDKPGKSSVEIGGFNVISNRSGTYFLRIDVLDPDMSRQVSQTRRFAIYRAGERSRPAGPVYPDFAESAVMAPEYGIYDQYDEAEIDNEFQGASYLASKEDLQVYKALDLSGKRDFIKSFWANRDQDRTTLRNEFRQDYLKRLELVNDRYGGVEKGWKSDQGRVFLVYGEPEEIQRYPSDNRNKGYEIWLYYEVQSGVQFVFVDLRGLGDFVLVHSTAKNEYQDPDWQQQLVRQ